MRTQGSPGPRCFWCNAAAGDLVALGRSWGDGSAPLYAHPDHSAQAVNFISRTERLRVAFLVAVVTAVLLAPIMTVVRSTYPAAGDIAIGAYLVLLGGWLTVLPFATPQTVRWLGARAATRLVRALGILILGAGSFIGLAAC